ncbi:MAG: aldo/keto reductase [Candidatus Methylacidiphilales bacterium]
MQTIRWGIVGAGAIARTFVKHLGTEATGRFVAVASRSRASAEALAADYPGVVVFERVADLLKSPEVDVVYIAAPHPAHAPLAIAAAEAGKHVLCEKPAGLNFGETMAILDAARRAGVFFMEAFMYRCHPQTVAAVEAVRSGELGRVRLIEAAFCFRADFNPGGRLFDPALGGGAILDVGCYTVSAARLLAGAALGGGALEPLEVNGAAQFNAAGTDSVASATLLFPQGILARVLAATEMNQPHRVVVHGDEGTLTLDNPWFPGSGGGVMVQDLRTGKSRRQEFAEGPSPYEREAATVVAALRAGQQQAQAPAPDWHDSSINARTLDRWRESVGLVYPAENPSVRRRTVRGQTLRVGRLGKMPCSDFPGCPIPVSRLVLGTMAISRKEGPYILEEFIELGGNALDTAHVYSGGQEEAALGRWLHAHPGIRDRLFLIGKGAHTPYCDPRAVSVELDESLERMGTDHVDLYFLHRDNPKIPVGEFVDALNRELRAGRIRAFGGSNWSRARIDAANAYAKKHRLRGFFAVSNNFSLARMVDPVWSGCISSAGPEWRRWFRRTGIPLFAWSSQARGFFTPRSGPRLRYDPELVRCWYSPDNFERKRRAEVLAQEHGVSPLNIALAYVLAQPFPTFALIGPRTIEELYTSLPALQVALSSDDCAWLNLERSSRR